MGIQSTDIVQRLWNDCHVLRDDGVSCRDWVEQLTYLVFLKMLYEAQTLLGKESAIPAQCAWPTLTSTEGDELKTHYRHVPEQLGSKAGGLGLIFRKTQNRTQDPAKLRSAPSLGLPPPRAEEHGTAPSFVPLHGRDYGGRAELPSPKVTVQMVAVLCAPPRRASFAALREIAVVLAPFGRDGARPSRPAHTHAPTCRTRRYWRSSSP